jgi:hypothetical protein
LDGTGVLLLSVFGSLSKAVVILLCVVSGALSLTAIASFFIDIFTAERKRTLLQSRRDMRSEEREQEIEENRKTALARIAHLTSQEIEYFSNCLKEQSQSFTTYAYCPHVATLQTKGLIYTPGGSHHQDYYPYVIHDFVWSHLLGNQELIISIDDENKRIAEEKKRNSRRRR